MSTKNSIRIAAFSAAVAGGAVAGALLAAPAISGAQDAGTSTTEAPTTSTAPTADPTQPPEAPPTGQGQDPQGQAPTGQAPDGQGHRGPRGGGSFDPSKGGHVGKNGTKEELLTGDAATRATAAAQAAVPDGTVERVETDAEGATNEAHVRKSDGSEVTVKMDADFNVTSIEDGPA